MRFEVSHIFISSENSEVSPSTSEYFEADPGQSELIRVIRPRTRSPVLLLSLPHGNSFCFSSLIQLTSCYWERARGNEILSVNQALRTVFVNCWQGIKQKIAIAIQS